MFRDNKLHTQENLFNNFSTMDPGYVVNFAETCAEDNPVQIVTDYQVEPNSVSDVKMADESLAKLKDSTSVTDYLLTFLKMLNIRKEYYP